MNDQSDNLTHRRLAASCFNKTWEYLRKPELSAEEAEEMIHVCPMLPSGIGIRLRITHH